MNTHQPDLRPLGVTDLIDAAFSLYRKNFVLFAGIAAVLLVPETIINMVLAANSPPMTFSTISLETTGTFNTGPYMENALHNGLVGLLSFLFSTLITGALAYAISQRYLGKSLTVGQAYREVGLGTFLRLLGADILEVLAIVVPMAVAGIVIGGVAAVIQITTGLTILTVIVAVLGGIGVLALPIFLWVRFLFIAQAVVLDQTGPVAAFRRSWNLVRGSTWRVLGTALLLYLIVTIVSGLATQLFAVFLLLGNSEIGRVLVQALGGIVSIVVRPVLLAGLTMLYYDQRIRTEAFDLEQLARRIGEPATP